jgi:hypothetical protein
MDITDIEPPAPEHVKDEEGIQDDGLDTNTTEKAEENKFQRAIAAWRSTNGIIVSLCVMY